MDTRGRNTGYRSREQRYDNDIPKDHRISVIMMNHAMMMVTLSVIVTMIVIINQITAAQVVARNL